MSFLISRKKDRVANRAVLWLILLPFLFKALIPSGMMLDSAALARGEAQLVICSGAAFKTITVDRDGKPIENGSSNEGSFCALMWSAGLLAAQPSGLQAIVFSISFGLTLNHQYRAAKGGLPPLGPRAPPLSSKA